MNSFLKKAGGVTTCVIAVCLINHSACAATWSGGGSESLWSDAGNWDSSPADGEALTFSGTARQINTNDLLTSVGAVDFTSTGWKVQGGAVTLGGNMSLSATGTAEWGLDTSLATTRSFKADSGRTLVLSGVLSGTGGVEGGVGYSLDGNVRITCTTNTFTGQLKTQSASFELTSLANGGQPSSAGSGTSEIVIGSPSTGASGSLNYIGSGNVSTDRDIKTYCWGNGGASIYNNSPDNGSLRFTSTATWYMGWRDNNASLHLCGSSFATNEVDAVIGDSNYTSGKITGIEINTSGAWALNGNNTYNGNTAVSKGTLFVNGAPTGTGTVNVASGGTLGGTGTVAGAVSIASGGIIEAGMNGAGTLTLATNLTFTSGSIHRFNGGLTRGGGDVVLGDATLTLALNDNDFSTNSVFWIIDKTSDGAVNGIYDALPEGGLVTTRNDRTFYITYEADYASGDLTNGNDVAVYSTSAITVTWNGGGDESLWSDNGNWDAAPTNGANLVFSGTLRTVNTNDSLARVGNVYFGADAPFWTISGSAVELQGTVTAEGTGPVSWDVDTSIESGKVLSVASGGSLTVSGQFSGSGGLSKAGGGSLTLADNSNDFSGPLSLYEGTLTYATVADIGAGASSLGAPATAEDGVIGISGGTTLTISGSPSAQSTDRALRLTGAAGNLTLRNNSGKPLTYASDFLCEATGSGTYSLNLYPNSGGITLGGAIGNFGPDVQTRLVTSGANWNNYVVSLTATNSTYSGETVIGNGTVLEVTRLAPTGEPSSIGTGSDNDLITFAYSTSGGNNATLLYIGTGDAVCDRRLYFYNYQSATKKIINNSPDNSSLTMTGLLYGTLAYNVTAPIGLMGSSTATNVYAGQITEPSQIERRFSINISTAGAWALTATNNTYTGGTDVNAGLLLVNNAEGPGPGFGVVNVNAGGTLGGTGTVAGAVSVLSGGTLAAGFNGNGTLNLHSNLTFAAGSTNLVRIAGKAAGHYTSLHVTDGDIDLGGATLTVDASSYSDPGLGTFLLIDVDGTASLSGTFDGLPEGARIDSSTLRAVISYAGGDGNDVVLDIVPSGTLILLQ